MSCDDTPLCTNGDCYSEASICLGCFSAAENERDALAARLAEAERLLRLSLTHSSAIGNSIRAFLGTTDSADVAPCVHEWQYRGICEKCAVYDKQHDQRRSDYQRPTVTVDVKP